MTSIQCWMCQGYGHRASASPHKAKIGKGGKGGGRSKSTGKGGKGIAKPQIKDKAKGKKGDGKAKGGGGGGGSSVFAGGAATTTADDGGDFDVDFDDDDGVSTTDSEDSSSDYKGQQAAGEEEPREIDDAAICQSVTKLKRGLRWVKLADGTRRHNKKAV